MVHRSITSCECDPRWLSSRVDLRKVRYLRFLVRSDHQKIRLLDDGNNSIILPLLMVGGVRAFAVPRVDQVDFTRSTDIGHRIRWWLDILNKRAFLRTRR